MMRLSSIGAVRRAAQPYVPVLALALAGLAAACAESPLAPATPSTAPSRAVQGNAGGWASYIESQRAVGDTTVTVFWVTLNERSNTSIDIGFGSRILFPYSAASICDLRTPNSG